MGLEMVLEETCAGVCEKLLGRITLVEFTALTRIIAAAPSSANDYNQ